MVLVLKNMKFVGVKVLLSFDEFVRYLKEISVNEICFEKNVEMVKYE